jgi:hypothetical protein
LSGGSLKAKFVKFLVEPGKIGLALKTIYTSYSIAGGPGLGGQRTFAVDVIKGLAIGGVAATNAVSDGIGLGRPVDSTEDFLIDDFQGGGLGYLEFY